MLLLDFWSHLVEHSPAPASSGPPQPPAAVEQIFRRHVPRLYRLARRITCHEADAEDVVGDVLVQVMRKLDTFRGDAELSTWLHRVTVNAALAQGRKQARRRERQLNLPPAALEKEVNLRSAAASPQGPEQQALAGETRRLVESAIADLPEVYREVCVLADVECLPNAEVGRQLGLSLAAVKSRLHRARLLLRQALAASRHRPGREP